MVVVGNTRRGMYKKVGCVFLFASLTGYGSFSAGGAGRGAKDDTYAQDDASHKPARPQSKTRIQTNNITNNPQHANANAMLKAAPDAEPPGRSEDRGGGVVSG